MVTLLILVSSIFVGSFVGYFVHRMIHKPWAGPLYRGHMEHHLELYPKGRLVSDTYELKKWYNSGPVLFTPALVGLVAVAALLTWLLGISWWHLTVFGVGLVGFGLLNDWVHDSFHLRRHILHKLPHYRALRKLHFLHHIDMTKNFGIVTLSWDDVFKTKSDT